MTTSTNTQVSAEEQIEALAWRDLYLAAPANFIRQTNLKVTSFGAGTALALPTIPAVEFNRVLGVRGADIHKAYDWIVGKTDHWTLQIDDAALDPEDAGWLESHGLRKHGFGWSKFTRGTEGLPIATDGPVIVRAANESEADLFGQTVCRGFGFPDELVPLWAAVVGRKGWSCMIAYINGEPVGSGLLYVSDRTAWLGAGSTIKEHRNKGAQTELIKARLNEGYRQGARLFAVETGQPEPGKEMESASFKNMQKNGFQQMLTRANYKRAE